MRGLEIAVLLVAALPFARVWLEPGFRRKLVVFPRTAAQIVAASVLALGGTVLFCVLVPHGLTFAAAAALPAIAWERWRARSRYGRASGLPPGSLALAPVGPWRDERFYERQAARHGPVFKLSNYVQPMVCVVGLERGLRLLSEHDEALGHAPLPFSRRIPHGFLRYMDADSHRKYRPLLSTAVNRTVVRAAEPFAREQIDAALVGLARSAARSPERGIRSLASTIFVGLALGLEPGDADHARALHLLDETDYLRALWRRESRVDRALTELTVLIAQRMRDAAGNPARERCSFASELGLAQPDAAEDETVLRNLAYILQTGSHDLGGLCVWLVKLLADHPDWAAIVRDEAATLPGVHGLDAAERIVLETLRLRQSEYLARRAESALTFDGHTIPAGWLVRVCVRESHRDGSVFPSPDSFDPDRFLAGRPPRSEYSPFGAAPRSCLGRHVTLSLASLFVRQLSDGYDLRTVADGPLTFGPFHWRPSPAFRVELTRVPPAARACKGSENRTTAPLARA